MRSPEHEFVHPPTSRQTALSAANVSVGQVNGSVYVRTHSNEGMLNDCVIHVTNYNQNGVSADVFPEDSVDSVADVAGDDVSMAGEPPSGLAETQPTSFLKALTQIIGQGSSSTESPVKNEQADLSAPYHVPVSRFQGEEAQNLPPQKELKILMKEVEKVENPGTVALEMKCDDRGIVDKLTSDVPKLEIVEEPELTYRARYESEGCKGPIHGASESGFPSVKVLGYVGDVVITVSVVTREYEPHLHTVTGPGSSKADCEEIKLQDGTHAIQMLLKPADENDDMIAIFDQLSIRRIRNWEADRELLKRGIEPCTWKNKKKEARLAFQARIAATNKHAGYILTCYSRPFLCTAPSGNPEIWWASLSESPASGGQELGLIGKKFQSGFKVRFFTPADDGDTWECYADIDRTKCNLNACVVKVPAYKDLDLTENVTVNVEVRVGPERDPRCSDSIPFTYIAAEPDPKHGSCDTCAHFKMLIQRALGLSADDLMSVAGSNLDLLKTLQVSSMKTENAGDETMDSVEIPPSSVSLSSLQRSPAVHGCESNSILTSLLVAKSSHSKPIANVGPQVNMDTTNNHSLYSTGVSHPVPSSAYSETSYLHSSAQTSLPSGYAVKHLPESNVVVSVVPVSVQVSTITQPVKLVQTVRPICSSNPVLATSHQLPTNISAQTPVQMVMPLAAGSSSTAPTYASIVQVNQPQVKVEDSPLGNVHTLCYQHPVADQQQQQFTASYPVGNIERIIHQPDNTPQTVYISNQIAGDSPHLASLSNLPRVSSGSHLIYSERMDIEQSPFKKNLSQQLTVEVSSGQNVVQNSYQIAGAALPLGSGLLQSSSSSSVITAQYLNSNPLNTYTNTVPEDQRGSLIQTLHQQSSLSTQDYAHGFVVTCSSSGNTQVVLPAARSMPEAVQVIDSSYSPAAKFNPVQTINVNQIQTHPASTTSIARAKESVVSARPAPYPVITGTHSTQIVPEGYVPASAASVSALHTVVPSENVLHHTQLNYQDPLIPTQQSLQNQQLQTQPQIPAQSQLTSQHQQQQLQSQQQQQQQQQVDQSNQVLVMQHEEQIKTLTEHYFQQQKQQQEQIQNLQNQVQAIASLTKHNLLEGKSDISPASNKPFVFSEHPSTNSPQLQLQQAQNNQPLQQQHIIPQNVAYQQQVQHVAPQQQAVQSQNMLIIHQPADRSTQVPSISQGTHDQVLQTGFILQQPTQAVEQTPLSQLAQTTLLLQQQVLQETQLQHPQHTQTVDQQLISSRTHAPQQAVVASIQPSAEYVQEGYVPQHGGLARSISIHHSPQIVQHQTNHIAAGQANNLVVHTQTDSSSTSNSLLLNQVTLNQGSSQSQNVAEFPLTGSEAYEPSANTSESSGQTHSFRVDAQGFRESTDKEQVEGGYFVAEGTLKEQYSIQQQAQQIIQPSSECQQNQLSQGVDSAQGHLQSSVSDSSGSSLYAGIDQTKPISIPQNKSNFDGVTLMSVDSVSGDSLEKYLNPVSMSAHQSTEASAVMPTQTSSTARLFPSITDAIASNSVGYREKPGYSSNQPSRSASPMDEADDNVFMKTLQQLNSEDQATAQFKQLHSNSQNYVTEEYPHLQSTNSIDLTTEFKSLNTNPNLGSPWTYQGDNYSLASGQQTVQTSVYSVGNSPPEQITTRTSTKEDDWQNFMHSTAGNGKPGTTS